MCACVCVCVFPANNCATCRTTSGVGINCWSYTALEDFRAQCECKVSQMARECYVRASDCCWGRIYISRRGTYNVYIARARAIASLNCICISLIVAARDNDDQLKLTGRREMRGFLHLWRIFFCFSIIFLFLKKLFLTKRMLRSNVACTKAKNTVLYPTLYTRRKHLTRQLTRETVYFYWPH